VNIAATAVARIAPAAVAFFISTSSSRLRQPEPCAKIESESIVVQPILSYAQRSCYKMATALCSEQPATGTAEFEPLCWHQASESWAVHPIMNMPNNRFALYGINRVVVSI
jgi:hypothetical protein